LRVCPTGKAREGKRKHRLIIDPVRAPVVLMIFEDYCLRFLGLGEICEKLNRNLDRFPPPIPNRKDDYGLPPTWSRSVLHGILRNPKYTGFNVWGCRDKRKGRLLIRPRDQWVWSPTPTHEAIVSRELFESVEKRSLGKRNSIKAGAIVRAQKSPDRPSTGRVFTLRGRVRCVFGPDRLRLLRDELADATASTWENHAPTKSPRCSTPYPTYGKP
jgi:site-specific DNA recombinase